MEASDYSSTFNQYVGGGLYSAGSYAHNTGVYLYNNPIEAVHAGLDAAGLVPLFGNAADLANATLYAIRGRYVEAGISSLAAVPFFGYIATSGQVAKHGRTAAKIARESGSVADEVAALRSIGANNRTSKAFHERINQRASEVVAPRTIKSLDDLPLMSPEQVKAALPSGYSKSTSWAYSIHDHHFYPKWLSGGAAGPTARVRGFEHITDLEPALFEHMKRNIDGLTQKSAGQIQDLIRSGRVTQDDITAALFDFYKARYPNMADDALLDILRQGL